MAGHTCYHCKEWVEEGAAHDCWTTTEAALTRGLSDDLQEAWERLRETAADLGEQRIYASHHSIMFSRKSCYFFVRPKKSFLEVCLFLPRALKHPKVRRADPASKTKIANIMRIVHRDEVEAPFTDWLRQAYAYNGQAAAKPQQKPFVKRPTPRRPTPKRPTPKRPTPKPPTPKRPAPKRPTPKQKAKPKSKPTRRPR
jgi:hypothetical protein